MNNTHTQGNSWSFVGKADVKDANGLPVDITNWTVESQLKNADGSFTDTFDCGWVPNEGNTFFHKKLNTSHWPIGTIRFMIKLTSPLGESITSSPTEITIKRAF